jgi:hypothetical protein
MIVMVKMSVLHRGNLDSISSVRVPLTLEMPRCLTSRVFFFFSLCANVVLASRYNKYLMVNATVARTDMDQAKVVAP